MRFVIRGTPPRQKKPRAATRGRACLRGAPPCIMPSSSELSAARVLPSPNRHLAPSQSSAVSAMPCMEHVLTRWPGFIVLEAARCHLPQNSSLAHAAAVDLAFAYDEPPRLRIPLEAVHSLARGIRPDLPCYAFAFSFHFAFSLSCPWRHAPASRSQPLPPLCAPRPSFGAGRRVEQAEGADPVDPPRLALPTRCGSSPPRRRRTDPRGTPTPSGGP